MLIWAHPWHPWGFQPMLKRCFARRLMYKALWALDVVYIFKETVRRALPCSFAFLCPSELGFRGTGDTALIARFFKLFETSFFVVLCPTLQQEK